jgi:hypothetical protein
VGRFAAQTIEALVVKRHPGCRAFREANDANRIKDGLAKAGLPTEREYLSDHTALNE